MPLYHLFLGFVVKIMTGFDDTITHVPVLASVTTTRLGKVAYSVGTLLAVCLAIIVALSFASLMKELSYVNEILASLLILLALAVYFDVFVREPREQARKLLHPKKISAAKFAKLFGIGFVASLATVIDDTVAYAPIFLSSSWAYAVAGIIAATLIEILVMIYFSGRIAKFKDTEYVAVAGLVFLAALTLTGTV